MLDTEINTARIKYDGKTTSTQCTFNFDHWNLHQRLTRRYNPRLQWTKDAEVDVLYFETSGYMTSQRAA